MILGVQPTISERLNNKTTEEEVQIIEEDMTEETVEAAELICDTDSTGRAFETIEYVDSGSRFVVKERGADDFMENALPKNKPSRLEEVRVNRIQFDHIFTDSAAAMGEKIARDLSALKDDIAPVADKTFVMMKNKQVWFDRNNAALFPKFEAGVLQAFNTYHQPTRGYSLDFEGFIFLPMTSNEFDKSFLIRSGNPYLQSDGYFKHFPSNTNSTFILTEELDGSYSYARCSDGDGVWKCDTDNITLVPIYRLRKKNAAAMSYPESILSWIANGLVPEGLNAKQEKFYQSFIKDYPTIEEYITVDDENISFDSDHFKNDVINGAFTKTIFDYNFDIKGTLDGVLKGKQSYSGSVDALKKELLECDHKRADLQPYDEKLLTDINRGHWDLFESAQSDKKDEATVQLPPDEMLIARPPQLDVQLHGTIAIDFGTKSTIVVCRNKDERMLRIGKGDYSKDITMNDFENPTAIQLRDIKSFLNAYRARVGRPFTEWNQVTVSHQAAEAIFKNDANSSVYNSVFNELKQWAQNESSYYVLKDLRGVTQEIKPYLETKAIDENDFDPIELYAYYLGLYINNMHRKIYLDYIMSFPVNYKTDVREHIRASFERGIKKSLPPALQADEQLMRRFRVYLGASEPAAYAISALEGYGLEPKELGEKVAYGVFDFGGGTTDFDFGIEYIPEKRKSNFVIDQFGFNGDVLLGGENILELLAYEVYKENFIEMRNNHIPFALPQGCQLFAGAESLVSQTKDAAAHMNTRILAEELRPIWERRNDYQKLGDEPRTVKLFSNEKNDDSYSVSVNLNIKVKELEDCIRARIELGVENFFQSLFSAFQEHDLAPIHIFLAGNSCKSPFVQQIFNDKMQTYEEMLKKDIEKHSDKKTDNLQIFELHPPLGQQSDQSDQQSDQPSDQQSAKLSEETMNLDRQKTGKTGVAFGLLRCRKGGKDVKINNKNDSGDNPVFQYFLGNAGADGKTFTVQIGRDVDYGHWAYFTGADETDFEIYYTTTPLAMLNTLPIDEVSMLHCIIDDDDVSDDDDVGIYIRKVDPNTIEYAVGTEDDFSRDFNGKIYREKLL